MIPRILVPTDINPVKNDDESKKSPRRLTTLLDERTVVPTGTSTAPPLDGKSSIPSHFPLGVLVNRTLVPRGMPAKPFENLQPPSEYAPLSILQSRTVVPAYVEPIAAEELKEFERPREFTPGLRDMVEPDLFTSGEANLLVEPEEKRDPKSDLTTRVLSVAVHIGLIIFLIFAPKIFPAHVPTAEETELASKELGVTYISPHDIPASPAPAPRVHIDRRTLNKVAPPRIEAPAPPPAEKPVPSPIPPKELPSSPVPHIAVVPKSNSPLPSSPAPSHIEPPKQTQSPGHLNLGIPNASPGKALQDQLQNAVPQGNSGIYSQGGSIPRGAGAGGRGPGMGEGVQILSDTQGVDFNSYIQRLLATLKRNWYAVMPESAMMGDKGVVYTTFVINPDGSVPQEEPTLERTSGKEPLDAAAMSAIRASSPFEPLPPQFHGPNLKLRIVFLYNIPIADLNSH